MNLYMKVLMILLSSQLYISQSNAQTLNPNNTLAVAPMSNEQKIKEVYGVHFFDNKPELEDFFLYLLENRVQVVAMPQEPNEKYTHLNDVPLLNKINPNLVRDTAYDPDNFNPLKYQMNFYAKGGTMIYRIDSENVIVIAPQN